MSDRHFTTSSQSTTAMARNTAVVQSVYTCKQKSWTCIRVNIKQAILAILVNFDLVCEVHLLSFYFQRSALDLPLLFCLFYLGVIFSLKFLINEIMSETR